MNTRELQLLALDLMDELEASGGEVTDVAEGMLLTWLELAPDKLEALRFVAARLKTEAQHNKDEAARFTRRRKSAETALGRVMDMATHLLEAHEAVTGESKVKAVGYTAYLAKSVSTRVTAQPEDLPEDYRRVKVTANTTAIKKHLQGGGELPGCALVTTRSARFR